MSQKKDEEIHMEKDMRKKLEELLKAAEPSENIKEELFQMIPELKLCEGFLQNTKYHDLPVLEHTLKALDKYKETHKGKEDYICLIAILLHDVAKPLCYTEDARGGHFYGHADKSCTIAQEVLDRLNYNTYEKEKI